MNTLYFIYNKEEKSFYNYQSSAGFCSGKTNFFFTKLSFEDSNIQVSLFNSEAEACSVGNQIINEKGITGIEIHPISKLNELAFG